MGFFDFFNSEYRQYKKIYDHINNLPAIDERYKKGTSVLNKYYQASLMFPLMRDKRLFQNKEKMQVLIPYFSGVGSLVGRAVKLNDDELDMFVIFFLVLWLCDGDYRRMKEMGDEYLAVGFSKEKEALWEQGANDVNDILNQTGDSDKIFMRLNKLL